MKQNPKNQRCVKCEGLNLYVPTAGIQRTIKYRCNTCSHIEFTTFGMAMTKVKRDLNVFWRQYGV